MSEANGWRWLPLTVGVIGLDQYTKHVVVQNLSYAERINVLPVFDITHVYNTGAAFSFLAGAGGWQRWMFTVLALGVGAVLLVWMKRLKARAQWMLALALSLILAGAIGNVIDRIRLGHVVDFILVYWDDSFFPAFNIADAAITIGAGLLLLDALLEGRRARAQAAAGGGSTSAPQPPKSDRNEAAP